MEDLQVKITPNAAIFQHLSRSSTALLPPPSANYIQNFPELSFPLSIFFRIVVPSIVLSPSLLKPQQKIGGLYIVLCGIPDISYPSGLYKPFDTTIRDHFLHESLDVLTLNPYSWNLSRSLKTGLLRIRTNIILLLWLPELVVGVIKCSTSANSDTKTKYLPAYNLQP